MDNNQLSTEIFYGMILTGAKQVIINEGELNQLNVFPVADRDTGTNLASMMRYIVDNLSITRDSEELVQQLSQHGLVGCSGNSGLIFSQFFYGLTQHKLTSKTVVKLQDFAHMIMHGYKSAYTSVSNPQPGTMLTVMEKWAHSYREFIANTKLNVVEIFQHSVDKAKEALHETINQLEVLRQNKVVDAGAQGFVHFIEGMLLFLKADNIKRKELLASKHAESAKIELGHEHEEMTEMPNYRYCFEMVLRTPKDKSKVLEHKKELLLKLGDSMVIGHAPQMEKLHIHTNKPDLITRELSSCGDVVYQKIDDMTMQYNITNTAINNDIAVVIDSLADLPPQWIQQNNIFTFPIQLKVNNNAFLDKFTINFREALIHLNTNGTKVATAAPSLAIVSRGLHFLSQHYRALIVLPMAKGLSSTYDVIASQVRKIANPEIRVIDSCKISACLGLLVAYTQQLIKSNKYTPKQIAAKVEAARENTNAIIFINSLNELIKSGRLPRPVGFIAKLLRVKPILCLEDNGKPRITGVAFSRNGGWKKISKILNKLKAEGKVKTLAIVHSGSETVAQAFSDYIVECTAITPLYIAEASSAAVVHTGRDGISIGYSQEEIQLV